MVFMGLYFEKNPIHRHEQILKIRENIKALMKWCSESEWFVKARDCKVMLGAPKAPDDLAAFNETTQNLFVIPDVPKSEEHMVKTNRIAQLRNNLVDQAGKMFADAKYYVVFDGDGIVKFDNPTLSTVQKALKVSDKWDAVFFHDEHYYDYFALRCNMDTPNCFHFGYNCKRGNLRNPDGTHRFGCLDAVRGQNREEVFQPVASAFNGLAIYKSEAIKGCQYDGTDVENGMDCEHVAFNKCISGHGGKVVVSGMKIDTYRGARAGLFAELPEGYEEIPGYGLINVKTGEGLDNH